jgi:hypothetical protein
VTKLLPDVPVLLRDILDPSCPAVRLAVSSSIAISTSVIPDRNPIATRLQPAFEIRAAFLIYPISAGDLTILCPRIVGPMSWNVTRGMAFDSRV